MRKALLRFTFLLAFLAIANTATLPAALQALLSSSTTGSTCPVALTSSCSTAVPVINYVSTDQFTQGSTYRVGALVGNVLLYLKGTGLSSDVTASVVKIGDRTCEIDTVYTSSLQIACWVPASTTFGVKAITVTISGKAATCDSSICYFKYDMVQTPILSYLVPVAINPVSEIKFGGIFRVSNSFFLELSLDGYICDISSYGQQSFSSSTNDFVKCVVGPLPVGSYDVGLNVLTKGNAIPLNTAYNLPDAKGHLYNITVLPEIESLSSHEGTTTGQVLVITGSGFSSIASENQVFFGDSPCYVQYAIYNSLQCYLKRPAVINSTGLFASHAGLKLRTFTVQGSLAAVKQSSQFLQNGGTKTILLSAESEYDRSEGYSEALEGFFKAPTTGSYKFLLSAQGAAELYISEEPLSKDNLTFIAEVKTGTGFRDFYSPKESNQISKSIELEEGKYYYLQAIHLGVGTEHITIGAIVPNQERKYNSLRKVISIKIEANVTMQQATLRIRNSSSFCQIGVKKGTAIVRSTGFLFPGTNALVESNMEAMGFPVQVQSRTMVSATEVLYTFIFTNTSGVVASAFTIYPLGLASIAVLNQGTSLLKGYFELGVLNTVVNFNFDETTDSVRDLLLTVPGIGMPRVTRYGNCRQGCEWIIQFDGNTNDISTPVIVSRGTLQGGVDGSLNLFVNLLQDSASNDLLFAPIPYNMLFTAETSPQITVKTKGFPASCPTGQCHYSVRELIVATIVDFTLQGDILEIFLQDGETLTSGDLRVFFADIEAQVISYDPETQTIVAQTPSNELNNPQIVAGYHKPEVLMQETEFLHIAESVQDLLINPVITNVEINTEGKEFGFLLFTLTGSGFGYSVDCNYESAIDIDGVTCWIYELSNAQAFCFTDIIIDTGLVTYTVNGLTATYSLTKGNPDITVPLEVVNAEDSPDLVLKGDGFTNTTNVVITNNGTGATTTCDICSFDQQNIVCSPSVLPPGNYTVVANTFTPPDTLTQLTTGWTIPLVITSIEPQYGSQLGGTVLTITGQGFTTIVNDNQVSFGQMNYRCNVFEASSTVIKCLTTANTYSSEGPQIVSVLQRLEYLAECRGDCDFYFSTQHTPTITNLSQTEVGAGDSLTITGTLFTETTEIKIAGVIANVLSFTAEQIIVEVPKIPAGRNLTVTAYDPAYGNFFISENFTVTHNLKVDDYSPKIGSIAGTVLTIIGKGFSSTVKVTIGSKTCQILTVTTEAVTCKTDTSSQGAVIVKQDTFQSTLTGTFASAEASTPSITAIQGLPVTSASSSLSFGFQGQKLDIASPVKVILKSSKLEFAGEITSATGDDVQVSFTDVSAGKYNLTIQVGNFFARTSNVPSFNGSIDVPLTVNSLQPVSSSLAGGVELTITGAGFSTQTDAVSVQVEGFDCLITSSAFDQVTCTVPPLVSEATQSTYKLGKEILLTGTYFSNGANEKPIDAFDNTTITYFKANRSDCSFGVDFGEGLIAQLTQIQFYSRNGIDLVTLSGSVFEGSIDNVTYTPIATLGNTVYDGWNTISSPMKGHAVSGFRYLRFRRNTASSKCEIAEVQAKGVLLSGFSVTDTNLVQASAKLQVNGKTATIVNAVEYRSDLTPIITSLSPSLGSSKGGTELHLYGTNLDQATEVKIDDIVCQIVSVEATEIVCTTGPLPPISQRRERVRGLINVYSAGQGKAVATDVSFMYAEKWSDRDTWGCGGLPKEYDSVHVETGMNLLIDISPPKLVAVIVEGALIFQDANITLVAEYILVRNGFLQIGTESEPIQNNINITLYGTKKDAQLPIFGNKVIGLYEGTVDIHGAPRVVSATLATTVQSQGTSIQVLESVDWKVGERIAISSTSYDPTQTEERTIVAITGNNIELDQPLEYTHIARQTEAVEGTTYDFAAQIILLSRNILIQGDITSGENNYGAHLLFYDPGTESTIVRISNTEITRAGQAGFLGRFPINFQHAGNQMRSYVSGNSIHHTYQRGIQLQGTHYLTVQKNTLFAVQGYGINLQDGIERFNVLEDNIVLSCRSVATHLSTQENPIGIRISNPTNFFRRNKVIANPSFGFWFDLKSNTVGAYASKKICPSGEVLGAFDNNFAAWNTGDGIKFDTYIPRTYPCRQTQYTDQQDVFAKNLPIRTVLQNNIVIGNKDRGIEAYSLGALVFDGLVAIDNGVAGIDIVFTEESPINSTVISNSVIIGSSDLTSTASYRGIRLARSEGLYLENITFMNFAANKPALEIDAIYSSGSYDSGARTVYVTGLKFLSVILRVKFANSAVHIFRDIDGSLTDIENGGTLVNNLPHLRNIEACTPRLTDLGGLACDNNVSFRRVVFSEISPDTIYGLSLKVLRLSGDLNTSALNSSNYTSLSYRNVRAPSKAYALPFCLGYSYQVFFAGQADYTQLSFEISPHWTAQDTPLNFVLNHTAPREDYDLFVTDRVQGTRSIRNTTDLWDIYTASAENSIGKWHHNVNESNLYISVAGGNGTKVKVKGYECRVNCPPPLPSVGQGTVTKIVQYWSNATIWPGGVLPREGENVLIPWDWALILDINPPALNTVEIQGDLIFDGRRDENIFMAKKIWVRGRLIVGSESEPFAKKAKIILVGTRNERGLLINDVFDVGTKVIGVTGELLLYGQTVTERASLSQTVLPGSKELKIDGDLTGWVAGYHVALTSSTYGDDVYETAEIESISGNTVTLKTAVRYLHYSGIYSEKDVDDGFFTIDFASQVILLNRSIQIQGTREDNWGAKIIVTDEYHGSYATTGRIELQYVSMEYCGQYTSQAAINFDSMTNATVDTYSIITGSVIRDSLAWGVKFSQSQNAKLIRNTILNTMQFAIYFYEYNSQIEIRDNYILSTVKDTTTAYLEGTTSGIYLNNLDSNLVVIQDNVVAGCEVAYILKAFECGTENPYSKNVAHSSKIGFLILTDSGKCAQISDLTAYRNDFGVLSYFAATEITAKNLILSDNEVSINLNAAGRDTAKKVITIKDSLFAAFALAGCQECYTAAGSCQDKTAIMLGVATQEGKQMPPRIQDLPWTDIHSSATFNAEQVFSGNTFVNFKNDILPQCTQNVILKSNKDAADYTPYVSIKSSQLVNVTQNNLAYFYTPVAEDRCGKIACTGLSNILIKDLDGTFLGARGSLIPNNQGVVIGESCTFINEINGFICREDNFALLEFESLDADKATRVISPVNITSNNGFFNQLNAFKAHEYYANHLFTRLSRFPAIIQKNKNYEIEFSGTLPTNLQFQIEAASQLSDYSIVKVKFYEPKVVSIVNANTNEFIHPVAYEFNKSAEVRSTDPCGTNYFDREEKTINFKITADPNCKLLIKKTNVVAVNVRYDMTEEEFYQQGGAARFIDKVASILGISHSRIRVVSIVKGSVILNVEIIANTQGEGQGQAANTELQSYTQQIAASYRAGDFDVYNGASILDFSYTTILTEELENGKISEVQLVEQTSPLIIALISGIAVIIAVLALIFVYKYKKRLANRKMNAKIVPSTPQLEIKEQTKNKSNADVPATKKTPKKDNDVGVFESVFRQHTESRRNLKIAGIGSQNDLSSRPALSLVEGLDSTPLSRFRPVATDAPSLAALDKGLMGRNGEDTPLRNGEDTPATTTELMPKPWLTREILRNRKVQAVDDEEIEKIEV